MSEVSGKALDLPILKRVLGFVKPYRGIFYLTAVLTIALAFAAPIRPMLIQQIIDEELMSGDMQGLWNMTMLLIGVLIAEAIVQFFQSYLTSWLGQSVIKDLRTQLYQKVTRFRLKYFDNTALGTLVTRVVSDIETIADVFSQGLLEIIGDILKLIVVIGVMLYADWKLTLICLIPIPILIASTSIVKNWKCPVLKKLTKSIETPILKQFGRTAYFSPL